MGNKTKMTVLKVRDKAKSGRYKGISLLDVDYKALTTIIKNPTRSTDGMVERMLYESQRNNIMKEVITTVCKYSILVVVRL